MTTTTPARHAIDARNWYGCGSRILWQSNKYGGERRDARSRSLGCDSGIIGYSDSAGKPKKCLCNQSSLYPMIFSKRRSFLGQKDCYYSRIVTLTCVTVTDRACI